MTKSFLSHNGKGFRSINRFPEVGTLQEVIARMASFLLDGIMYEISLLIIEDPILSSILSQTPPTGRITHLLD